MVGQDEAESEVLVEHGGLLWSALSAFGEDPRYLAEMVEAANQIRFKRAHWEARAEAVRVASHPDEVKDLTVRILEQRGVDVPAKRKRAA